MGTIRETAEERRDVYVFQMGLEHPLGFEESLGRTTRPCASARLGVGPGGEHLEGMILEVEFEVTHFLEGTVGATEVVAAEELLESLVRGKAHRAY